MVNANRTRALKLARVVLSAIGILLALRFVPSWWCGRDAARWSDGEPELQGKLAATVSGWLDETSSESFGTGSARFDGEWVFGTYMMAAMGFGQVALEQRERDPALAARARADMRRAIARMLSDRGRAFDSAAWNADALATLDGDDGHVAYLGYANLALSLERRLDPDCDNGAINDRVTAALERRFARAHHGLLETYPGETYPVDNASAIASIALHHRALGQPPSPVVRAFVERIRARYIDPRSGLLIQSVTADGAPLDAPRASGTALAAYFLSYADMQLSAELTAALKRANAPVLGFGVLREYPPHAPGDGDIDSGPLVFGRSISATGFAVGAARRHGDRELLRSLYATLHLMGAAREGGDEFSFVSGGPLAAAIMLAMLTAPAPEVAS